ncbi:hypothetical protein ACWYXJ_10895 [Janthinobacterium lividum]
MTHGNLSLSLNIGLPTGIDRLRQKKTSPPALRGEVISYQESVKGSAKKRVHNLLNHCLQRLNQSHIELSDAN